MELSTLGLQNRVEWEAKGYKLPKFDREAVTKATKENPRWIHFGAGNIFRAFQANVMQNILDRGEMETGLIVAEGFDYEIIEKNCFFYFASMHFKRVLRHGYYDAWFESSGCGGHGACSRR